MIGASLWLELTFPAGGNEKGICKGHLGSVCGGGVGGLERQAKASGQLPRGFWSCEGA